ncbi:MAG TPA: hypothetical protein VLA52_16135, partial [Thermohalobaculum sp.]|nr:hypothetical protein [Thermohalobaculum sp.]
MEMPVPSRMVLDQKATLVARLTEALGPDGVIDAPEELRVYECDALTAYRCPCQADEIVAVSVGVKQSQETLRTALAMGADRAILIEAAET